MCDQSTLTMVQEAVSVAVKADRMFTAFDISKDVKQSAKNQGLPVERHRNMKNEIHNEMAQYIDSGLYEKQLMDIGAPTKAFVYYPTGQDPTKYAGGPKNATTPAQAVATPKPDDEEEEDEEEEEGEEDEEEEEGEEDEEEEEDDTLGTTSGVTCSGQCAPIATASATAPCACGTCVSGSPLPLSPVHGQQTSDSNRSKGMRSIFTERKLDKRGALAVPSKLIKGMNLNRGDLVVVQNVGGDSLVVTKDGTTIGHTLKVDKYRNVRISKSYIPVGGDSFDFDGQTDKITASVHK